MELKIKRSQSQSGLMSKKVEFQVNVQLVLTSEERKAVEKYRIGDEVVYNSEASRKNIDASRQSLARGGIGGVATGLVRTAMARLSLNLTINNLTNGQTVTTKSLEEAMAAEEAVREACVAALQYIGVASLFDGSTQTIPITLE